MDKSQEEIGGNFMFKKVSAIILALTLTAGVCAIPSQTFSNINATAIWQGPKIYTDKSNNFEYKISNDNTIDIAGYIGKNKNPVIPSTLDNKTVTSISGIGAAWIGAFEGCDIISLTIPRTVTDIDNRAFGHFWMTDEPINKVKINCYKGSAAEKFAKKYGFDYKIISKAENFGNVSGLKASTEAKLAKLSWKRVENANGYIVYRYSVKSKKYVQIAKIMANAYYDPMLTSGKNYRYAVKAYTVENGKEVVSPKSTKIRISTKPLAPKVKTAVANNTASLKWNKVARAAGYQVFMKTSPNEAYKLVKTTKDNNFTSMNLENGKTYYFAVKAYKKLDSKKVVSKADYKTVKI